MEHLVSEQTREKFFLFLKDVATNSGKMDLSTELDLGQFHTPDEFYKAQKGDKYLE